jgi:hypothetical protein
MTFFGSFTKKDTEVTVAGIVSVVVLHNLTSNLNKQFNQ